MRFTIAFSIALFFIVCAINTQANETDFTQIEINNSQTDIVINSSPVSQLILSQEAIFTPLDSSQSIASTSMIKGEFSTRLLSLEAGVLSPKLEANWSKFYFKGALTLHQHADFNVSLMANIEQINSYNYHNEQAPSFTDSLSISETELNYSYGIITSYTINSGWQFSGGIIHAAPVNDANQTTWYGDEKMALIGTTYSF